MMAGVVMAVVAGIMLGAFALPMKKIRVWSWEHTWLVFSLTGLTVFPLLTALATVPRLPEVLAETPLRVHLAVAGFAALWGLASMGYGMAVKLTGIAIANAVVLGLNNAIGSILPIAVFTPRRLLTASGLGVTGGVVVMLLGILLSARAGYLRDRGGRKSGENDPASGVRSRKGLIICFAAGILGSFFTFALISGKPIERIAVSHGASAAGAPNAIWPVALFSGCLVAIAYCVSLMVKNRNVRAFVTPGGGINWLLATTMGALWFGGVMLFGSAATKLGELGVSVGWAVLQSMTVTTGAVLGFLTGEWKGASRRIKGLLLAGISFLVLGILVVVKAGTL